MRRADQPPAVGQREGGALSEKWAKSAGEGARREAMRSIQQAKLRRRAA